MRLDLIPTVDEAPAEGAEPSRIRLLIAEAAPPRRAVLRGLAVAVAAATLVPFQWILSRREASAAGPTTEYVKADCTDAYPGGYGEQSNNWWISSGPASCFGGFRRGSYPCSEGYHFEGSRNYFEEGYTSNRIATACGPGGATRNAWRWTSDRTYRCSDAITTVVWTTGERFTGLTVAMCAV